MKLSILVRKIDNSVFAPHKASVTDWSTHVQNVMHPSFRRPLAVIDPRQLLAVIRHRMPSFIGFCDFLSNDFLITQNRIQAHLASVRQTHRQCDDCQLVSDVGRRRLRSSDVSTCVVPRTHTGFGDRAFQVAGPILWNSLPASLRQSDTTVGHFKKLLKTHLFS